MITAVVALWTLAIPAPGPVVPNPEFGSFKTLRCAFADAEGRDSFTTPNARISDRSYPEVVFDSIDYAGHTARMIGNIGASDVTLINGELALTFVEMTSVGGIIVTTIFKGASVGSPLARTFRAVTSRHIARSFGGETATQHYGVCRALLPGAPTAGPRGK
jgi:hypothetical protein